MNYTYTPSKRAISAAEKDSEKIDELEKQLYRAESIEELKSIKKKFQYLCRKWLEKGAAGLMVYMSAHNFVLYINDLLKAKGGRK